MHEASVVRLHIDAHKPKLSQLVLVSLKDIQITLAGLTLEVNSFMCMNLPIHFNSQGSAEIEYHASVIFYRCQQSLWLRSEI